MLILFHMLSIYEFDSEPNDFSEDLKNFFILIQIVFATYFNTICFYFVYFFKSEFTLK